MFVHSNYVYILMQAFIDCRLMMHKLTMHMVKDMHIVYSYISIYSEHVYCIIDYIHVWVCIGVCVCVTFINRITIEEQLEPVRLS